MTVSISIVGMACEYPDAHSPSELWENVLACRRSFRRIPTERLSLQDYYSTDRAAMDRTYASEVAVIRDYEFDRVKYKVAGNTFRSADYAHWLALDVAHRALASAGLDGPRLPKESTGVFLGNTLTGEFSRANILRLRWPYVRRVVDAALTDSGWAHDRRLSFLSNLEAQYKAPFPPIDEESLAGGLSNTIAGRICAHFDLNGGGYTVDGACASSLLAVSHGCSALASGDLDVAIVGGVDLSLDPFELVGFAKTNALANDEMRVFDSRSAGFWPGEGCGIVVLMRSEEARSLSLTSYATIRGWGISSDGSGGITRPKIEGQLLALRRAYKRSGYGIDTIGYFEGHGTGTAVGDATELKALIVARHEAGSTHPAAIGSVKALIGHTKAAAGVAGLIKAIMAVDNQVLPPTAGCSDPHPELLADNPVLRTLTDGSPWPRDIPVRAGVSGMGFGGINAHITIEGTSVKRDRGINNHTQKLLHSVQDAELLLLGAGNIQELQTLIDQLLDTGQHLARAELADLAAELARRLNGTPRVRGSIVASTPAELVGRLTLLRAWLEGSPELRLDPQQGVFLGFGVEPPRLGFLFPGQGSPVRLDGGIWRKRFEQVDSYYATLPFLSDHVSDSTNIAQPAIAASTASAMLVLNRLGLEAEVAIGHSLGELSALCWGGAIDDTALFRIAQARGRAMAEHGDHNGAMASLHAAPSEVADLVAGEPFVIAGLNGPQQTVISGQVRSIEDLLVRLQGTKYSGVRLPVSHAFHSPLVADAVPLLAAHLEHETFGLLRRKVISTVTGSQIGASTCLPELLCRQITAPVQFYPAWQSTESEVDLWIEVGPGKVLSGLVSSMGGTAISVDASGPSLRGLLTALGATFALGSSWNHHALFGDRFTRPIALDRRPSFFVNPCELAPASSSTPTEADLAASTIGTNGKPSTGTDHGLQESVPELVRTLVAERAELPKHVVQDDHRLLSDLHLNSISVGQLVIEATRRLGLSPPVAPTVLADATIRQVVDALGEMAANPNATTAEGSADLIAGIGPWIRAFEVSHKVDPCPPPSVSRNFTPGECRVVAPRDHPLAIPLQDALRRLETVNGVVVCLPPVHNNESLSLLLEGARSILSLEGPRFFGLLKEGGCGAAFARSLHLEIPDVSTCVVDLPIKSTHALDWFLSEVQATRHYNEAVYDSQGMRRVPILQPVRSGSVESMIPPINHNDHLVVSGGGKGIAAECSLALARETGVRLTLLGRSSADSDRELSENLRRMEAFGLSVNYIQADVTKHSSVQAAIVRAVTRFGPVTALLHGAGSNFPKRLSDLDMSSIQRTLAPKVDGLNNLLGAVDHDQLRLLVTFGSIIARVGMRGEADYALANEWLTHQTEAFQLEHPSCTCLSLEWSVWSGVGMGERLGSLDTLIREGITPIPPETGASIFTDLITHPPRSSAVVVTGRFGDPPTIRLGDPDLPFLRFLEQTQVCYPGVELVVDSDLTIDTDPYLNDHVFEKERLLPAVVGLEAMAQAASALLGRPGRLIFEDVHFDRPVSIPVQESVTIRLAALVTESDTVDIALRCSTTNYRADHFRTRCRFVDPSSDFLGSDDAPLGGNPYCSSSTISLDPVNDLYGTVLFQSGRFRRIASYKQLTATECFAQINDGNSDPWFSQFLPKEFLLGDPATRDAAIHAIQACIPHRILLPLRVARISLDLTSKWTSGWIKAVERSSDGSTFVYDLAIYDQMGQVRERWEGLQLRSMQGSGYRGPWPVPLLGPYLQRYRQELIPGSSTSIVVTRDAQASVT